MSTTHDFVYLAFRLPGIQTLLSWLDRKPTGFQLLNRLSGLKSVYPSFPSARAACLRLKRASHDNTFLMTDGFQRSIRTRPSDYPTLFWLAKISGGGPLRVFDFGGGSGQSYYQYQPLLAPKAIRQWTCMDLPAVVARARQADRAHEVPGINFSSSLEDAAESNVFHAAGSFHYWEQSIDELVKATHGLPDHLIINRSPFREKGSTFLTVQRGGRWAVPCKIWNLNELAQELGRFGFQLVDRWQVVEKSFQLPLLPDFDAPYRGAYFVRSPVKPLVSIQSIFERTPQSRKRS